MREPCSREVNRHAVLITRPQPGADETAARVTAMRLVPVLAPLMTIQTLPARLPARIDAVVVTSRNALTALPPALRQTALFAVGNATAAAARDLGFERVRSADGDAAALAGLVSRELPELPGRRLLHVTGRAQGHRLDAALRELGCAVHRRAVYAAVPARALALPAREALSAGQVRAALFFSAETAHCFVRLAKRARLEPALRAVEACAIGPLAGVALEALRWRRIRIADRPTQDEMLALLR